MDKIIRNALEEVREYIVYNDIEIENKEQLTEVFVRMMEDGYFSEAKKENKMREVRAVFSKFTRAYEEEKDILETDLIIRGPRIVLEKLENYKKR